jgi:hypothetical protein
VISEEAKSKLRRLLELRDKRDNLKTALEKSETDYREAEADVYEAMEESGVKSSIKVDLGAPWGEVGFRPRETYYGRIIDDEKAIKYYEERALIDEVSSPKFVMRRINEEVRDRIEAGNMNMPPGVDYYVRRGVTITREKD